MNPCVSSQDCDSYCDHPLSRLVCVDRACACTLPAADMEAMKRERSRSTLVVVGLACVVVIVYTTFLTVRVRCPNGPKRVEHGSAQDGARFIASTSFRGARRGYVFKTKDGRTGYYRDDEDGLEPSA